MGEMLSIRNAARVLGVHENTIRNMINDGRLAAETIPGRSGYRRVPRSEISRIQHDMCADEREFWAQEFDGLATINRRHDEELRTEGVFGDALNPSYASYYATAYEEAARRLRENEHIPRDLAGGKREGPSVGEGG